MTIAPVDGFTTSWMGEALPWECDELAHLNMRFYLAKAALARRGLLAELGLPNAFKPGAIGTAQFREVHIKYIKEARPGDNLRIDSAVIGMTPTALTLCHLMYHRSGQLAAALTEHIDHISRRTEAVFPWPARVLTAAQARLTTRPEIAAPRGLDLSHAMTGPSRETLISAGARLVGKSVWEQADGTLQGRVRESEILGKASESVGHFSEAWPEISGSDSDMPEPQQINAAVLEIRFAVHRAPFPGDAYEFYTAMTDVTAAVRTLTHNIVNPVTGLSWASMTASACLIDLSTRRLVKLTPAQITPLRALIKPGVYA